MELQELIMTFIRNEVERVGSASLFNVVRHTDEYGYGLDETQRCVGDLCDEDRLVRVGFLVAPPEHLDALREERRVGRRGLGVFPEGEHSADVMDESP